MFCPFCGDSFIKKNGEIYCERGDMGLSKNMERILTSRYDDAVPQGDEQPAIVPAYKLGRWFCPGCGILLDEQMSCARCGKSLKDCHYRLVELHPHRQVP